MKKLLLTLIFILALGVSYAQQSNHWTTITGTQYNLTMSGVISIDGIAQTSTALEVGAFCGNECRGSARAQFFPPTGDYVVSLTVVSNEVNGETITFRLYDHRIQQEFPSECVNSISFSANSNFGEMGNWYPFAFVENGNATQTVALSAGTNWVSFDVETDLDALKAALVAALPGTSITIQSKSQNTKYNPNNNRWTGRLTALDLSQMYMVTVASEAEVTLEGMPINPADHPVTITSGVNWIAFPLGETMTIANAFADFAVNNDVVQSKTQSAKYNSSTGRWSGQLKNLEPGKGYIYKSVFTGTRTFTYPTSAK